MNKNSYEKKMNERKKKLKPKNQKKFLKSS